MSERMNCNALGSNPRWLLMAFLLTWGCWPAAITAITPTASADDGSLKLRFKGGGYVTGTLLPSNKPGHVRLQCPAFEDPLEFGVPSLSSLEADVAEARRAATEQFFYLSNGAVVAGTLTELNETHAVIDSPCLKIVRLPRETLHHFSSNTGFGKLLYTGPRGGDDWAATTRATDWRFEAGALITTEPGATAVGYVNLPDKCEIRIALGWSTQPNFTLSLACNRPVKATERISAAASLEVWDGQLMMVREGDDQADISPLPDLLSDRKRLELTIYLDQPGGVVAVCTPNGRLLGKLVVKEERPMLRRLITLTNHSGEAAQRDLRLLHCDVRQWNGEVPREWPEGDGAVLLDDGQVLSGMLGTLAAGQTEIAVVSKDGKSSSVPLKKIQRAIISAPEKADEASAEAIVVELADGNLLVGDWTHMDSDRVVFTLDGVEEPVKFLQSDIVGVIGNPGQFEPPKITGKIGMLKTGSASLTGCLVDSEGDGVLRWHALGASAPSRLSSTSQGVIQYDSPRPDAATRREVPPRRVQPQGGALRLIRPGWVLGGQARDFPAQPAAPARKPLELGLKLRRGDQLAGTVVRIDERGVTFQSPETNVTFLPGDQIDSVILATSRTADTQSPEKLKRLMTVPRASKNDPPTHLLISVNGDYLRGRLVELDDKRALMEVRLEEVELPTDRIAEIHWLYHRDWQEDQADGNEPKAAEPAPSEDVKLHVHLMRQDGRPLTFLPSALSDQTLQGKSDLLGDCKVDLSRVTTVRFGANLAEFAQKEGEEAWMLSLATLPKVYQESGDAPGKSGSPLVGKPAPQFMLDTASGEKFELSNRRGRVLVLDFWASWCGPCLQTMPDVERIVDEVGANQVDLIAVNLQETRERALATIKRLNLSPTVLLDEDGSVAQQYQATAIPQTVIIDRQGNVTHLFVGGGQRFLNEFTEALTSVVKAP